MLTLSQVVAEFQKRKEDSIKEAEERWEKKKVEAETLFSVLEQLAKAEFKFEKYATFNSWWQFSDPVIRVEDVRDFRKIHTIVGTMQNTGMHPDTNDARKRIVNVYLKPKNEKYDFISFVYSKKLPPPGKSKCKLVRVRSTSVRLVCES